MSEVGHIVIQAGKLRDLAEKINNERIKLDTQFQEMNTKMASLEQKGWNSESGRDLRKKFSKLYADYQKKYPPAMNSYVNFLNQTAKDYEDDEKKRKSDVETMKETFN